MLQTTADGFSEWTAAAKTPELNITDTEIDVQAATTDEEVTIQVFVTNTGGADGTYEAQLFANEEIVDRKDITVPSNRTAIIDFVRSFDQPNEYEVQVNDVPVGEIEITEDEEVEVSDPDDDGESGEGSGETNESTPGTDDETAENGSQSTEEATEIEEDDGGGDLFGPGFGPMVAVLAIALVLLGRIRYGQRPASDDGDGTE
ncbi:hypothetical protein [Halovenus salina]|uniref:CARDB domain-containing protein n=1 Tax=Halovenus salina TaxID=1510225 RepID=A0ABD5VW90_9EURY